MRYLLLVTLMLLSGCASYKTYNQTTTGLVNLRGGIYQTRIWDDALVFKRMSWYHGMTLYLDVLIWKVDQDSPFSQWFSEHEKDFFNKCEQLLVTAAYSADPSKISHVGFREQMKLNGYDDVAINTFASSLKSHPQLTEWRFQNYKIMGYCKRSPTKFDTSNLRINFPSFEQLEVDL